MKSLNFSLLTLSSLTLLATPVTHAAVFDRLEASVNKTLILLSDVARLKRTMPLRAQLDPLFAGTSLAQKGPASSDEEVVDFLINEKLIQQAFPVSDQDVEQDINSIQGSNKIDRPTLINAIKEQGFTFEDYFELIRAGAAKRNLIERDIRTRVTISEDDIKNYYYNHYATSTPASRAYHLKLIAISAKSYKTTAAAKDVITRAKKELQTGEAFEEVAKRISDDASASSGGDLGTLTEDQMSPAIRDHLKGLKIGQISDVLGDAKSGFFILKLVDVKATEGDRYEKVKEEIRSHLAASEYQHQIGLWLERQRQTAFIHRAGQPSFPGLPMSPAPVK